MLNNPQSQNSYVKKIESDVDNVPGFLEKRYYMICPISKIHPKAAVVSTIPPRERKSTASNMRWRVTDRPFAVFSLSSSILRSIYSPALFPNSSTGCVNLLSIRLLPLLVLQCHPRSRSGPFPVCGAAQVWRPCPLP